jgi:hypothetical protein
LRTRSISAAGRDQFWHDARRKLGKLRRLSQSDIWQVEILIGTRIAKPVPVLPPSPQRHPCGLIQAESASFFNELLCTQKRTQIDIRGFCNASLRYSKIARTNWFCLVLCDGRTRGLAPTSVSVNAFASRR